MQILTRNSDCGFLIFIPLSRGATRISLPSGILFRPTALAGCTNATDGQTDGRTDHITFTSVAVASVDFSDVA